MTATATTACYAPVPPPPPVGVVVTWTGVYEDDGPAHLEAWGRDTQGRMWVCPWPAGAAGWGSWALNRPGR